jgi:hypothetical protein
VIQLAACEDPNTLDPTLVSTTERSDYLTYAVVGLENVSDADRRFLSMTGNEALVDVSPSLTSGAAFLQIRGGDGAIVYAEDIGTEVDGVTDIGIPGIWQIDVIYEEASGGFEFLIERDTVP